MVVLRGLARLIWVRLINRMLVWRNWNFLQTVVFLMWLRIIFINRLILVQPELKLESGLFEEFFDGR